MAEQFTFSSAFRDGGTIDRDELFIAPVTKVMNGARDQFLAGAGFARNQNRHFGCGDIGDFFL